MSIAEHSVRIVDGEIEFTCHGDSTAECHQYPDCEHESWEPSNPCHPFVPHEKCWMQDWFDNDGCDPMSDTLDEVEYTDGMSGPITTEFEQAFVSWRFRDADPYADTGYVCSRAPHQSTTGEQA